MRFETIITQGWVGLNGVYSAEVRININGVLSDPKFSTFFPDNWSEDDVLKAINSAFNNKVRKIGSPNSYIAKVNGVEIEMFVDLKTGKLIPIVIENIQLLRPYIYENHVAWDSYQENGNSNKVYLATVS